MNQKRKILFTGEASYVATGFGTIWNEVIKRLHGAGELDIAEMGSYAHEGDPRNQTIPWKFYPVAPHPQDEEGNRIYKSNYHVNQFGALKFPEVCLDYKPDIVCGLRDFWMDEYIQKSPFRDNFIEILMPTIDGEPQKQLWLDNYKQADYIFTYSEYGKNLLQTTGRPGTNFVSLASPGVDLDMFYPVEDKKIHKQKLGLPGDALIIGMVSRNQKRKLFFDLIEAFSMWLQKSKSKGHMDLANRTFLYLHTSYPDVGYDIGKAAQIFGVSNKILMTYLCSQCKTAFAYRFGGEKINCIKCKNQNAHPTNANHQCPRDVLAAIYNLFDIYVQYSICEGDSMTLREAQACGIPTMAVDYSAMQDHLKNPTSIPIKVQRFFWEPITETEQKRALPDNMDFVNKLDRFLKLNHEKREQLRVETRKYCETLVDVWGQETKLPRSSWDRTAAIWGNLLRTCNIKNQNETWLCPRAKIHKPNLQMPKSKMDNIEFANWVIESIWGRNDFKNTYFALEWATALGIGWKIQDGGRIEVNRESMVKYFLNLANEKNILEQKRISILNRKNKNGLGIFKI